MGKKLGRHRRPGRPTGSKTRGKHSVECVTRSVFKRKRGRIIKVTGKNKRSCVKKK